MASKACFFVTIFKLSSLTIYSLSAAQVNKVSATVVEKRKHEWCPRNISYSQGRRETGENYSRASSSNGSHNTKYFKVWGPHRVKQQLFSKVNF